MLKDGAQLLAEPINKLYNLSMTFGNFPCACYPSVYRLIPFYSCLKFDDSERIGFEKKIVCHKL